MTITTTARRAAKILNHPPSGGGFCAFTEDGSVLAWYAEGEYPPPLDEGFRLRVPNRRVTAAQIQKIFDDWEAAPRWTSIVPV